MSRFETSFRRRKVADERAFGVTVLVASGPRVTETFIARRSDRQSEVVGLTEDVAFDTVDRTYYLPVESVAFDGVCEKPVAGFIVWEGDESYQILPNITGLQAVEHDTVSGDWVVHTKKINV